MKLTKLIFIILCIAIITSSCGSIKRGLTGQKKSNSDEFLIQKKNPLVLPPNFGDLPKPANEDDIDNENNEIDLSKVFEESNDKKIIDETDTSLEQSILKKLIIIDAN